jgi:GMP synthase (glutamine-hydrolysing)
MNNAISLINLGSQFSHLLKQAILKLGFDVKYHDSYQDWYKNGDHNLALVLSGGPKSVYEDTQDYTELKNRIIKGIPTLGICYGMQLIAQAVGARVVEGRQGEYGSTKVQRIKRFVPALNKLCDVDENHIVWMSHRDHVTNLPSKVNDNRVVITSITENRLISSFEIENCNIFCLQYHPEVKHTENGLTILGEILERMTGYEPRYQNMYWLDSIPEDINKAVVAFSGGVDSLVAATYVHKELGSNCVKCIYIDTGMMRIQDERHIEKLKKSIGLNIVTVDAREKFLNSLIGITEPEEKRKTIGRVFIEVLEEEFSKLGPEYNYLVQGTIAADIQESSKGSNGQDIIKSHHNVGGLPNKMNLRIYEPLKDLYKSDVREFGHFNLHILQGLLNRHPFPGPGLGIRIIGEITEDKLRMARHSDQILYEELMRDSDGILHYNSTWQAFTFVMNDKAVGVKGDSRSYGNIIGIRAVNSSDGMTATWTKFPYEILERLSNRIMNEVDGVTRVVYDISNKPSGTIEVE